MPEVAVLQGLLDGEGPYSEIVVPIRSAHQGAQEAFGDLSLVDLNVVLYLADGEERDATKGEFACLGWKGV
jgi:glycogen debranching enzyme